MFIEDCFLRGGVWYNIWGKSEAKKPFSSQQFIESFFNTLQNHNIVCNSDLMPAIIARENRQTTNLGNGIAIPHPGFDELGDKSTNLIPYDTIYLAYPRFSLSWDEGASVFAVFFICMKSKEKHLMALSELAKGLAKPGVMELLRNREPLDILLPALKTEKI